MNYQELLQRVLDARTVLSTLNVDGIEQKRKLVAIYDHMAETAKMIEQQAQKEE